MLSVIALKAHRDLDLSELVHYLRHSGIPHSTSLEGDVQVVWVESEQAAEAVRVAYRLFEQGLLPKIDVRPGANSIRLRHLMPLFFASPLTLTILLATLICFPITSGFLKTGEISQWLAMLTFTDVSRIGGQVVFADLNHTFESGQYWRLVTPMLLHFGWLHLIFNSLWLWEFGRRIEQLAGGPTLLLLVLVSSLVANVLQYVFHGVGLVGGMSGVVFGLLGFALVWRQLLPARDIGIQAGIYIFMLVYLVLGFTGVFDLLQLGSIANYAHLGGLIGGLLVGFVSVQVQGLGRSK